VERYRGAPTRGRPPRWEGGPFARMRSVGKGKDQHAVVGAEWLTSAY